MALLVNAVNIVLLVYTIIFCVKKRVDSCLLFYCLISLYFINIPLLFDSYMTAINGVDQWERELIEANPLWTYGTLVNIVKISVDSLVFNFCFLLSYWFVINKKYVKKILPYRPLDGQSLSSLSWRRCLFIAYLGLIVFMIYNGIDSFHRMSGGEWYENRSNNRLLALTTSLFVPVMSVGVVRALFSRDIILGIFILLPTFIIGYCTSARSQIISVIFYFLFYFFWVNKKITTKNFIIISSFVLIAVFTLTVLREDVNSIYPLYKDWAYVDLFYVYDVGQAITTHGLNTLAMIVRDFVPINVEDITLLVADTKYGVGWGSLHPSILGWAYVDLLNFHWLLAIFFGVWLAIFDRIRHKMPMLLYLAFLSYEFSFLAIAIRGSVHFAYSQLFYPTLLLILLFVLDRVKLIKCHA